MKRMIDSLITNPKKSIKTNNEEGTIHNNSKILLLYENRKSSIIRFCSEYFIKA